jgi:transcriptional regulator with XRE-family HTH domain
MSKMGKKDAKPLSGEDVAIGRRLRALRGKRTLTELELLTKISNSTLSRYENGVSPPSVPLLEFYFNEGHSIELLLFNRPTRDFVMDNAAIRQLAVSLPPDEVKLLVFRLLPECLDSAELRDFICDLLKRLPFEDLPALPEVDP